MKNLFLYFFSLLLLFATSSIYSQAVSSYSVSASSSGASVVNNETIYVSNTGYIFGEVGPQQPYIIQIDAYVHRSTVDEAMAVASYWLDITFDDGRQVTGNVLKTREDEDDPIDRSTSWDNSRWTNQASGYVTITARAEKNGSTADVDAYVGWDQIVGF